MRIALFDWTTGGHHALYVRRFSEALKEFADVVVAVPDVVAEEIRDCGVGVIRLGGARPALDLSRPLGPQHRKLADVELALFERVARETQPEHIVHLYGDPVIRRLVGRPSLDVVVTICIFFPRAHYPRAYGTPLSLKETLRGWFQLYLQARWRRRRDAHAMLFLDEEAARGISRAQWLPEPPVAPPRPTEIGEVRSGCILYGTMARRKGIDLLARAVALGPLPARVVLAGAVEPGFESELGRLVVEMETSGTEVDVRARPHREEEGLAALRSATCAVLPYPDHYSMSRVLVEAAVVGTPVIVHDRGLLGHLVRERGLGLAVDCRNPKQLRAALLTMTQGSEPWRIYGDRLAAFAARFSRAAFEEALRQVFVVRTAARREAVAGALPPRLEGDHR